MLQFCHPVLLSIAASLVCFKVRGESATGIRLVGAPDTVPNAGRVEIWSPGVSEWIAVCDNKWDFQNAQVVCRELGYTGTGQVKRGSYFGGGKISNSSVVEYNCFGTEPSLSRCPTTIVTGSCPSGNAAGAGVVCTGPGYVGCYRDHGDNYGETFLYNKTQDNMTIEMCLSLARDMDGGINDGSAPLYAGLQNGDECWYGMRNFQFAIRMRADSACIKACEGNPDQTCGSFNGDGNNHNGRLSIYDVTLSYCVDPGPVLHGTRAFNHAADEFYYGTIVNVTCDSGFHLQGAPSIQCVMSKPYGVAWSAPLPECLDSSTTPQATAKTDSTVALTTPENGLPSTMPTKIELCQPNIGVSVGLGGAFTLVIVIVAVLIAVCYVKTRRGPGADHSPKDTANADTEIKLHPPRDRYEERITTSLNNAGYAKDTSADEGGETKESYATIHDDVTMTQSDGSGWEDNTLYETSGPANSHYIEVS